VSKRVFLTSDADVEFEFELRVLNAGQTTAADFSVFPLKGLVPARGSTAITIDYAPKRPVTSQLQLQVRIAQFEFKPFVCTVTGVAHVLQLDLPVTPNKAPVVSERQKRLKAAKHLQQLRPTPLGGAGAPPRATAGVAAAAAASAAPLARPKAAGAKV
jgi:hypothetical protein